MIFERQIKVELGILVLDPVLLCWGVSLQVRYCFGAVYVYTLLHEVFQLGLDEQRLAFTNSVQGPSGGPVTLSWVLGAMVVEGMAEGKRFADRRLMTVIRHALFPGLRLGSEDKHLPLSVSAEGQGSDGEGGIQPNLRLRVLLLVMLSCVGVVCMVCMVMWLCQSQGPGGDGSGSVVQGSGGVLSGFAATAGRALGDSRLSRVPSASTAQILRMEDQVDSPSRTNFAPRKVAQE